MSGGRETRWFQFTRSFSLLRRAAPQSHGCEAGCGFDVSAGGDTLVGFCAPPVPEGEEFVVDAAGASGGAAVGDVTVVSLGCAFGSSSGSCFGN